MEYPTEVINIGVFDRLLRKEVMRHETHLVLEFKWQWRSAVDCAWDILDDEFKRRVSPSKSYHCIFMGATKIYY